MNNPNTKSFSDVVELNVQNLRGIYPFYEKQFHNYTPVFHVATLVNITYLSEASVLRIYTKTSNWSESSNLKSVPWTLAEFYFNKVCRDRSWHLHHPTKID